MNPVAKIGLGTVQWGLRYGIANRSGCPDASQIAAMLQKSWAAGISLLDTAYAYGEAEQRLGAGLPAGAEFRVVTKTRPLLANSIGAEHVALVAQAFSDSLARLRRNGVYGLLVHQAPDLLSPGSDRLWAWLQELKTAGRVSRIGVSVYHPDPLRRILESYNIDIVQLPFNLYDQRFWRTGVLRELRQAGVEVHARSAFLQGLLVLDSEALPAYFEAIRGHQRRLHDHLRQVSLTPLAAALNFSLHQPDIDDVIVGCESLVQLEEIIASVFPASIVDPALADFQITDEGIIDPSRWPG